jgi:hypothetical protein
VGRATTKAVVSASILILAANYLLTEVFFSPHDPARPGVTKSFGPKEVLRGIDLTVETGESLVSSAARAPASPSC